MSIIYRRPPQLCPGEYSPLLVMEEHSVFISFLPFLFLGFPPYKYQMWRTSSTTWRVQRRVGVTRWTKTDSSWVHGTLKGSGREVGGGRKKFGFIEMRITEVYTTLWHSLETLKDNVSEKEISRTRTLELSKPQTTETSIPWQKKGKTITTQLSSRSHPEIDTLRTHQTTPPQRGDESSKMKKVQ